MCGIVPQLSFALAPDKGDKSFIYINAKNKIKDVNKNLFGISLPRISRLTWRTPVDLSDPALISLLNELKPYFITIDNTQLGLPFYPESTGKFTERLGILKTFEKINITQNEQGKILYKKAKNNEFYNKNQPPHNNYDDLISFFEQLDLIPNFSLRIPVFFTDAGGEFASLKIMLDPKTGADLVHYLNDGSTTELGILRKKNGRALPYNIKYFVLGNELWVPNNWHDLSIDQISSQLTAFAKAMKQADPTIKVGINLLDDVYPHSFFKPDTATKYKNLLDFNSNILKAVKNEIDFVTFHEYSAMVGKDGKSVPLNKKQWEYIMAQNHLNLKYNTAQKHREIVDKYNDKLKIAVDEYNGPLNTLGGALYNADYIIHLLNNNYTFASRWSLGLMEPTNDFGLIKVSVTGNMPKYTKKPGFYVFKMFTNYFGDSIVETNTESSTFETKTIEWERYFNWPAEKNIPSIQAIASVKDNKLYLMVINRELKKEIEINIKINNFVPIRHAKVYSLDGPSIDSTNEKSKDNVHIKESTIDYTAISFTYSFKKHSVTVIILEEDGTKSFPADNIQIKR